MTFRRVYWVVEHLTESKKSGVFGVYTSIPDLTDIGIPNFLKHYKYEHLRLNLVKLDSHHKPFGTYTYAETERLFEDLQAFIDAGDFSTDEVNSLKEMLRRLEQYE